MSTKGKFKDVTGQKFENLTAIKRIGFNKAKKSVWLFLCDCGVQKEIVLSLVLTGKTKHCGCLKKYKIKDISGQKFGRLTAINFVKFNESRQIVWLFSCECGVQKEIAAFAVIKGKTKSCGCLSKDGKEKASFRHGGCGTRLYNTWVSMRERCSNPNSKDYKNYGGRKIRICEEWHDFSVFRDWSLNNGYADNLTIDRVDNNGNYEPSNVRFTTQTQQIRNRSNTKLYEINGDIKSLAEWCEILNFPYDRAASRMYFDKDPFFNEYNGKIIKSSKELGVQYGKQETTERRQASSGS